MLSEVDVVIYRADQRSCSQADWFRSYYTFNVGGFGRESRTPFGSLHAVNEHTLKSGRTFSFTHQETAKVLLIPIVGKLTFAYGGRQGTAESGQVAVVDVSPEIPLQVSNPFTSELISFMQLVVSVTGPPSNETLLFAFDIDHQKNQLVQLTRGNNTNELFFIGKFMGRQEGTFRKRQLNRGIFVYLISGTCEVHDRLLLPGDALSIRNVDSIDFEALTREAILLIVEVPLETVN